MNIKEEPLTRAELEEAVRSSLEVIDSQLPMGIEEKVQVIVETIRDQEVRCFKRR